MFRVELAQVLDVLASTQEGTIGLLASTQEGTVGLLVLYQGQSLETQFVTFVQNSS